MSFELSFAESFFSGDGFDPDHEKTDHVLGCIYDRFDNDRDWFIEMVTECLDVKFAHTLEGYEHLPEWLAHAILDKVRDTNTCRDLRTPIEVYIDKEGYYTLLVDDPGDWLTLARGPVLAKFRRSHGNVFRSTTGNFREVSLEHNRRRTEWLAVGNQTAVHIHETAEDAFFAMYEAEGYVKSD